MMTTDDEKAHQAWRDVSREDLLRYTDELRGKLRKDHEEHYETQTVARRLLDEYRLKLTEAEEEHVGLRGRMTRAHEERNRLCEERNTAVEQADLYRIELTEVSVQRDRLADELWTIVEFAGGHDDIGDVIVRRARAVLREAGRS